MSETYCISESSQDSPRLHMNRCLREAAADPGASSDRLTAIQQTVKVQGGIARNDNAMGQAGEPIDVLDRDSVCLVVDVQAAHVF